MWGILFAVSIRAAPRITLGLEEEVFITTPTRPTLDALYVLAKLLWRNPRDYYKHTASNFARGRDALQCLMSSVEIATRPHTDINALLDELRLHRAALADAAGDAYLVPVGHLFDLDAPTNTAGLHIHIGVPAERRPTVYANLAYFLPLLILLSASSPYAGGRYFGQSYRVAASFAIGALHDDPYYRFQDLILSRRLGTIEIRACDPIWDLERLRVLLEAVQAIAQLPTARPIDRARYAALRHQAACVGYTPDLQALHRELSTVHEIPEALLRETVSDRLQACDAALTLSRQRARGKVQGRSGQNPPTPTPSSPLIRGERVGARGDSTPAHRRTLVTRLVLIPCYGFMPNSTMRTARDAGSQWRRMRCARRRGAGRWGCWAITCRVCPTRRTRRGRSGARPFARTTCLQRPSQATRPSAAPIRRPAGYDPRRRARRASRACGWRAGAAPRVPPRGV
jgi:hypothetical protein